MLRAALRGTVSGLVGAVGGLMAATAVGSLVEEGGSRMAGAMGIAIVASCFLCVLAAPGAFLLGLPFTSTASFIRANVSGRRAFLIGSALAGVPVGLLNLVVSQVLFALLIGAGLEFEPSQLLHPLLATAAVTGGLGLGWGVGRTVWREAHPPAHGWERKGAC